MFSSDLKKQQQNLPKKSGVYLFWNEERPLYIGKAKNLKNRTIYYFKEFIPKRLKKMIQEATNLTFHITETENDALLLEAQLIKEKQPIYNILYKNGRTLYYIYFSQHLFPGLEIIKEWKIGALGPFLSYFVIKQFLSTLLKIFKVRTCTDFAFAKRKRPCMEYHFNRCSAPCVNLISQENYNNSVEKFKQFFSGKTKEIIKYLHDQMEVAIKSENYEEAAIKRDQLFYLKKITQVQSIYFENIERIDVIINYKEYFYVESIKKGAVVNIEYRKYQKRIEMQEFLMNYYITDPKHKLIGLSKEVNFKNYTFNLNKLEKKIYFHALQRMQNLIKEDDGKEKWKNILHLNKLESIEVYDCSHYGSKNPVCGMIYANLEGEFIKNKYRIWKNEFQTYNDLEILGSALERRAQKGDFADMILIDGGITQLNVAKKALAPYKNIFAFAKGEKRKGGILYDFDANAVDISDEMLILYLEKLRDEAHRWAKKNATMRFSKLIKIE